MKTKSIPTIKQSVLIEFGLLPETFRGHLLTKLVRIGTGRKYVYDDSVFRKMRCLKAEGKINYELAGPKDESFYKKLDNVQMFRSGKLVKYDRTTQKFEIYP